VRKRSRKTRGLFSTWGRKTKRQWTPASCLRFKGGGGGNDGKEWWKIGQNRYGIRPKNSNYAYRHEKLARGQERRSEIMTKKEDEGACARLRYWRWKAGFITKVWGQDRYSREKDAAIFDRN